MTRDGLVVVVGASGAFGSAMVARLVGEGHPVLAVGRTAGPLDELVERHGALVTACVADLTDDEVGPGLRDAVEASGRRVLAVVHGPGVAVAGGIGTVPVDALLSAVDIKVGGLLRLVRTVDPFLSEGSRIIAIGGHYGLEPSPYAAAAGVANAALISAVRQLSLAYGDRGVTAHTIAPGPADTERLRRVAADRAALQDTTADAVLDTMRSESSLGTLVDPEQVAWAVCTLLAPEASATTGSVFFLDGGRRRGLP